MKSTVTITLDSEILKEAREMEIQLSSFFNDQLTKEVEKRKKRK